MGIHSRATVEVPVGLIWMLLISGLAPAVSMADQPASTSAPTLPTAPVATSGPIASYRGTVSSALVEDWVNFSPAATADAGPERHVQDMLLTLALADEARRLGLDSRIEVRHELERQRYRQLSALLKQAVSAAVTVTEDDVERRWLEIRDSFTRPQRSRLRNLFKRFPPGVDSETKDALRQEMAALRRRVLEGESFARLAEEESDSQTRLQGGLLGNVRAGTFRPEIDAVAMALEAGELSEVLEAEDGLTLLYCEQKLDAVTRSDDELKEIARDQIIQTSYRRAWHELQQALTERARATYRWEVLAQPAPDPHGSDDPRIWVEFDGGALTVEETAVIWAGQGAVDTERAQLKWADVPKAKLTAAIEAFLLRKMTIREALSRGLHEPPEVDRRWFWKQQQVLSAKALAGEIQARLQPISEPELRAFFEAEGEKLVRPARFRLTVLALSAEERHLRRVYRQGAEIRQRISGGEMSLEEAARRHSVDPSAANGGQVGWVGRWQIPKRFGIDFLREMRRLEPGRLSKWVLSEGRLWLIRLDEAQDPRPMTFDEAKGRIENEIGRRRVEMLEAQIVAEWLEKLEIRFSASPQPN